MKHIKKELLQRRAPVAATLLLGVLGIAALPLAYAAGHGHSRNGPSATAELSTLLTAPIPAAFSIDSLHIATGSEAGATWLAAASSAVANATVVEGDLTQRVRLESGMARGYRLSLAPGERVRVAVQTRTKNLHFELLTTSPTDSALSRHAARSGAGVVEYAADRAMDLIVRIQPRLKARADYAIVIERLPALTFPVQGSDRGEVVGHFFDRRDGGRRWHRGVDIAGAHGTPVIAAADGVIERIEETTLGGLVIWLREQHSTRLHYYAHLQRTLVTEGTRVRAGTPIGEVGSTGNASPDEPHLHFGVYDGDAMHPLDPLRLLVRAAPATAGVERALAGGRAHVRVHGAAMRPNIGPGGPVTALNAGTEVQILAAKGRMVRVRLQDGREGFVASWVLQSGKT